MYKKKIKKMLRRHSIGSFLSSRGENCVFRIEDYTYIPIEQSE